MNAWRDTKVIASLVFIVLILIFGYGYFSYRPPKDFPVNTVISITDGTNLTEIAKRLEQDKIIRSPFWFTNFVMFLKHERKVVGGDYYFEKRLTVYEVAKRTTRGFFNTEQIKTTLPEGSSVTEMSELIKKRYSQFDTDKFIALAKPQEGFLFPDTYIFGANVQPEKVVSIMASTFQQKIVHPDIADKIATFNKSLQDVVTMASILEGEARQMRTRQIVAGILWERLRRGMPLQVDATFKYVNGKSTEELTLSDLKIDSPYNTYLYKGLPPTPISNPGLGSIEAAVTPIWTEYLYFLTDKEGNMHYAKTLEEHARNKNKYLR